MAASFIESFSSSFLQAGSTNDQANRENRDVSGDRQERRGHDRSVSGHNRRGRDEIVDYVKYWSDRTELPAKRLLGWLALGTSKFYDWKSRYGKANEHNGQVPRDWWLEDWEKTAIVDYHASHPLDGYHRLTFMMLDDDVVAVSPSSVYRVLKQANRLDRKWQTERIVA